MASKKDFTVIGATRYQMTDVKDKHFEIADWFRTHFAHDVKPKEQKRIAKLVQKHGYYEEGNRIYVIS